ncbi:MAG: NAD(P)/FAD-dependent oxidoreductase [Spirochaetales bacterium]|nr:NAD(P)/FAD-dependent oxidoreductase [Spirochaetales bacterium]
MSIPLYDIVIIGAGVSGSAIARKLSEYRLDVAVLEKHVDVSFGVSKANSGIIHAGFHHKPGALKTTLETRGNRMFDELHRELNFPFKRIGIIVCAFSYEEMKVINVLHEQGIKNGVEGIVICNRDKIHELEPGLNRDVIGGLYAPSGGIIEPYQFVFSLMESARKNGVDLHTDFNVERAEYSAGVYTLYSTYNEKVRSRYVINAAGLHADDVSRILHADDFKIIPRKGEEYILERNAKGFPRQVIFPVPRSNSKGILIIPTVYGTMMIGPTAEDINDKEDYSTTYKNLEEVFSEARRMVDAISKKEIITSFAGLRPTLKGNDFYIDLSKKAPNVIQVAGIQSPGLTASPAIALYVTGLLEDRGLRLVKKRRFDPVIGKPHRIRDSGAEEITKLIEKDPSYGHVVCRCECVSEAEVVEAIRKGHTTLDGIKFYTRAGMGRCQGGFCTYKIMKILMRETGTGADELTKRGGMSFLIQGHISTDGWYPEKNASQQPEKAENHEPADR